MFFLAEQTRRRAAMLLLFFFVAAFLVLPVARAKADAIPVWDIFNTPKEWGLDAIAFIAAKAIIKAFREVILRAMITGRWGGLSFSTSFIVDIRKFTENAARSFMSELTGINFCSGQPQLPPNALFSVSLRLDTECSFTGDLGAYLRGDDYSDEAIYLAEEDENNFWNVAMNTWDQKLRYEALAKSSFTEEFRSGSGFLAKRGSTGEIKTPGRVVGDYLQENV